MEVEVVYFLSRPIEIMGYRPSLSTLLTCGLLAGPLFVLSFWLQGLLRADYDPLRHPVSSLAIGTTGWVQSLTFLVCGGLTLAFARGLWRLHESRWGPILVCPIGAGVLGAGPFNTAPIPCHPPPTPDQLTPHTPSPA